jgi:hypothetical protein
MGVLTPDELAETNPAGFVRETEYIIAEADHTVSLSDKNGHLIELTGQVKIEDDGLVLDVFVDGDPTDATTWVTYAEAGLFRAEEVLNCIKSVPMDEMTRDRLKEVFGLR